MFASSFFLKIYFLSEESTVGVKKNWEKAVRLTAWADSPPSPQRSGKCEKFWRILDHRHSFWMCKASLWSGLKISQYFLEFDQSAELTKATAGWWWLWWFLTEHLKKYIQSIPAWKWKYNKCQYWSNLATTWGPKLAHCVPPPPKGL